MRKKPVSIQDALVRMEIKCAAAEHCSSEIRISLIRQGLSSGDIAKIIDSLRSRGFIDDGRFARAFVRDKYRFSAWGRHKISAALRAKQIDRSLIEDAMEEIDQREYVRTAFRTVASRLRLIPADDDPRKVREKLLRFGASRGYEAALIMKILDSDRLWQSRK
ncbi:MAG: RecX family transcriptional regulator [Paramuribaculum sp.]|nr:RecX family transcriptional regulator [Paramuribaculum sp.]